jgi:hypothetical protein
LQADITSSVPSCGACLYFFSSPRPDSTILFIVEQFLLVLKDNAATLRASPPTLEDMIAALKGAIARARYVALSGGVLFV